MSVPFFTIRKAPEAPRVAMQHLAGIFEAPPKLYATVEKWMLSTYCGAVLDYVNKELEKYSGDRISWITQMNEGLQEQRLQAIQKVLQMKLGTTIKIPLTMVAMNGAPSSVNIHIRMMNDNYWMPRNEAGGGLLRYTPAFPIKELPEGAVPMYQLVAANQARFKPGERLTRETVLHVLNETYKAAAESLSLYRSPMSSLSGEGKKQQLLEVRDICLKYTTKPKAYAAKAAKAFPVDFTGWKYLTRGASAVSEINKNITARNVKTQAMMDAAVENFEAAKKYYASYKKGVDDPALLKALEDSEWTLNTKFFRGAYWQSWKVKNLSTPPDAAYLPERQADDTTVWVPVSQIKLEPLLDASDYLGVIKAKGMGSITCIMDFVGHSKRGGMWNPHARELQVDAKPVQISQVHHLDIMLDHIRSVLRHEMQHVGQTYLAVLFSLKENAGLPSKNIRYPSKAPASAQQSTQKEHALRDVEFMTRLGDEVANYLSSIRREKATPQKAKEMLGAALRTRPFFLALKKYEPLKWKKAVSEFVKAAEQQAALYFAEAASSVRVAALYLKKEVPNER